MLPTACSRIMAEKEKQNPLLFNLKPQEHCSSSGSFDTLQCIGNLCYCGDANTGEMKSELVRLDFLHMLPCCKCLILLCSLLLFEIYIFKQIIETVKGF